MNSMKCPTIRDRFLSRVNGIFKARDELIPLESSDREIDYVILKVCREDHAIRRWFEGLSGAELTSLYLEIYWRDWFGMGGEYDDV